MGEPGFEPGSIGLEPTTLTGLCYTPLDYSLECYFIKVIIYNAEEFHLSHHLLLNSHEV